MNEWKVNKVKLSQSQEEPAASASQQDPDHQACRAPACLLSCPPWYLGCWGLTASLLDL